MGDTRIFRTGRLGRWAGALLVGAALAACDAAGGGGNRPGASDDAPVVERFTADTTDVFVGGHATLTAVFRGDGASIDGIGPVESGTPVRTPDLARTTTFTLTVRGGQRQVQGSVVVAASYRDRFRELPPSPVARTFHLATALPGGDALLMGGNSSETLDVPDSDTSQRFDGRAETLSAGPQLAFAVRAEFTTVARSSRGDVLLVGGGPNSRLGQGQSRGSEALGATGTFAREGDLALDHSVGGAETALGDGRVLVTGGAAPPGPGVEIYDPATGEWAQAPDLAVARRGHTATLLADGRVLVAGGVVCCVAGNEVYTAAAELYDPVAGTAVRTGSLALARGFHRATLLADGRVLVTGGLIGGTSTPTASAELYDPATGAFGPAGALQVGRADHAALLLTDGRVLVLGGRAAASATDLYDAGANRWTPGPLLAPAWAESTATLLDGGKVLVFGGEDAGGFPVSTVLLYE